MTYQFRCNHNHWLVSRQRASVDELRDDDSNWKRLESRNVVILITFYTHEVQVCLGVQYTDMWESKGILPTYTVGIIIKRSRGSAMRS